MRVKGMTDLNRNEYFDWKKEKVKELAKTGMKVADIAKELNMGEEDMYSFLSRNFGGVRRLRESVGVDPDGVIDKPAYAPLTSKKDTKVDNAAVASSKAVSSSKKDVKVDFNTVSKNMKNKEVQKVGVVVNQPTIVETFRETLRKEKENILENFKTELLEGKEELVEEMKAGLESAKIELLNTFKNELLTDLVQIAKGL